MKKQVFIDSIEYINNKLNIILSEITQEQINEVKKLFIKSKNIFVYGAGRSGLVAKAFAIRLVHLGFKAYVIGETITGPVQKNDLVIIISGSGETIPAVMTAEISYNIKAKVISITGKKDSGIAKFADITVYISAGCMDKKQKQYAPLGTLFEASVWILLDGLVADILDSKNETEETMRKRHATLQQ